MNLRLQKQLLKTKKGRKLVLLCEKFHLILIKQFFFYKGKFYKTMGKFLRNIKESKVLTEEEKASSLSDLLKELVNY